MGAAAEGAAVALMRTAAEAQQITPLAKSSVAVAAACGRRRAKAVLGDLISLLQLIRQRMDGDDFDAAAAASVAAGAAAEALSKEGRAGAEAQLEAMAAAAPDGLLDAKAKGKGGSARPGGRLTAGLDEKVSAAQLSGMRSERDALRGRCAQLQEVAARRTRVLERLRQEVPEVEAALERIDAAAEAEADADEAAAVEAEAEEAAEEARRRAAAWHGGRAARAAAARAARRRRRPTPSIAPATRRRAESRASAVRRCGHCRRA